VPSAGAFLVLTPNVLIAFSEYHCNPAALVLLGVKITLGATVNALTKVMTANSPTLEPVPVVIFIDPEVSVAVAFKVRVEPEPTLAPAAIDGGYWLGGILDMQQCV